MMMMQPRKLSMTRRNPGARNRCALNRKNLKVKNLIINRKQLKMFATYILICPSALRMHVISISTCVCCVRTSYCGFAWGSNSDYHLFPDFYLVSPMSRSNWKILSWNIRGINADSKWTHVAKKNRGKWMLHYLSARNQERNFRSKLHSQFLPKKIH